MKYLKKFNEQSSEILESKTIDTLNPLYDQITDRFSSLLDPKNGDYNDGDYEDMFNYNSELNTINIGYRGEDHDFDITITIEDGQYLVEIDSIDSKKVRKLLKPGNEDEIVEDIAEQIDKTNI